MRPLVLFAHAAFQTSQVHRVLVERARAVAGVTFHDLYEAYPDYDVDVEREQALLAAHEVIVLQHPFYWYSVPPLLKQWMDLVLEHGWAYGREGRALAGKAMMTALSTGGGEEAYRHEGRNRHTIRELLAPIEQTARLCGMRWLPPFVVHGTHRLTPEAIARAGDDYARVLEALRDDAFDLEAIAEAPRLLPEHLPARGGR